MDYATTPSTLAVCQGLCKVSNHPPPAAPSGILMLSVILSHISQSLQAHLATVCCHGNSFHIDHSDIAFVVKFKFNEGWSEIGGGGRALPRGLRQPAHLSGYFLRFWTVYLGSIVKFNAIYE